MEHLTIDEIKILRENRHVSRPLSRLAFLFSCFTGLLPEEIEAVQFDNVHHSGSGLKVVLANRYVPLGRMAMEIFKEISQQYRALPIENQNGRMFGSLDRETMDNDIREWAFRAGIHRDITLEAGRPTFCVLALQAGVGAEELALWCGTTPREIEKYRSLAGGPRGERDIEAFDALFEPYFRQENC